MGLRVSGPGAVGHAGRAHPTLLGNPGGHAHPNLAILSGPEKPERSKRRSPCWALCPSPLEEPLDAQAQRLGLFPRPDLVSTGLGDAGKAQFQALGPHPENCDPEPPSPRRKHTSALPSEGGPTAGLAGWAAVHAAVTQRQGRDEEPHTPTPEGLAEEGRGQPSTCTPIG